MSSSDDAQRKKRIATIAICSFLLVAMVVAVTVGVSINETNSEEETNNGSKNAELSSSVKAIKSICQPTDYRKTCEEQLRKEAGNTTDIKELVQAAFKAAMKFASQAAKNSTTLRDLEKDPRSKKALDVCKQLMTYSINELQKSFNQIDKLDVTRFDKMLADLKIWLSATITNQQTCLDGFRNTTTNAGEKMKKALNISMQLSRNGLAIATEMSAVLKQLEIQGVSRRLLQDKELPVIGHSDWTALLENNPWNRRLLQDNDEVPVLGHAAFEIQYGFRRLMAATPSRIKPDIVVAKDGSGDFTTIKAAMGRIPLNAVKPFVIYIKEGVYEENLEFVYSMVNVALIGDGKEKTRITGRLNNADGVPTFRTATVAVNGDNFFAKNIGFENSAGAAKFQAVALMVISDFSVFYNCSMDGYQDTLYVHSKRQFYRDCTISGTIDFVFGDAAVVFQNCTFLVLKPLDKQQNIVTAQGRIDVRQPTAIVIQNSTFIAAPELVPVKDKFPTYLGRPWGNFSRTIIIESYLDELIKPEGWTIWDGPWGLNTCFYSEFNNHGPGSKTTGRVTWRGIKKIKQAAALGYTPGKFFDGDSWIKPRRVPYTAGLFKIHNKKLQIKVRSKAVAH
ncbi:putative pectinesterase/pectinesterase inhibitor 28 [Durio zibethinus]|uniref:Pectinesterase n=1 Tax=Durio zibethinus TaxID=66656 RepID=A0A6P5WW94_DURZI|nr:putative pectinesterase/pectinesterase inhibitor 28 [Durio zibethinus]